MPEPDDIPQWERRVNRFTTWLIVAIVITFPVLKIGSYLMFKPPGDPMNPKVQMMLNAWDWLLRCFS